METASQFTRDAVTTTPMTGLGFSRRHQTPRYLAFGRHLEEIHVTWAHLEKNGQDYGPTPTSLKIMFSAAGDGVTDYT
ncbi:hypothetical protein Tco_1254864 [Tanacetum coccineum]